MRGTVPILTCDDEYGCSEWQIDDYGMDVSSVDGRRVTQEERAPGWTSTKSGEDFCPEHKPTSSESGR